MAEQLIEQKLESLRRCLSRIQSRLPDTAEQLADDPDCTNAQHTPADPKRMPSPNTTGHHS